jgi:hypothetical protein
MAGFLFRLETVDGFAADPPTLEAAVPKLEGGRLDPLRSQDPSRGRDPRRRRRQASGLDRRGVVLETLSRERRAGCADS